jgi:hypothetical protein
MPDVPSLVVLYGKISRIRAISSPQVLAAAEQVLRRIADIYFEPPIVLSRDQIRSMLRDGSVDILRDFSQTCRAEFEMLRCSGGGWNKRCEWRRTLKMSKNPN